MDVARLLQASGGAARAADLAGLGASRHGLRAAIEAGAVLRMSPGVYAIPGAPPAAVARAAYRAQSTCLTACAEVGLQLPPDAPARTPHLAIPRDRNTGPRGERPAAVLHRVSTFEPGRARVRVLDAIDIAYECTDRMGQLVLLDQALRRRMLSLRDIGAMRRTPAARRRWLARLADPRAESLIETITRAALAMAGLTVEPQVWIDGVGRVDMVVAGRVVVEVDGRAYHSDPGAFREDRRRDRALVALGFTPLRFTYADVVGALDSIVADVRAALVAIERR
ncbi:endonuclease domain-containing protein [Demequina lignilytica]|uniref:DUF559 domain-containing protein n=1 Tax=Demequina lignilytica TaxID=3051663 RepID=A0AB35MK85_9MICO|nr:type IV toxin-antitoxin system AbiEi family antitoxin domain-containing protein [Demequina sp. SYSU T0a273]MDN4484206.1 DUF559 domain-containing protein [Demequina sp. SYSU T0a273]